MTRTRVIVLALLLAVPGRTAAAQDPACSAPGAAVRLDHAIVIVRDLGAAGARLESLGFRLKPGRLHADSLLNRHVKFRDGSELELMTLAGRPASPMAREYHRLLEAREGGAYAALWTDTIPLVEQAARRIGRARVTRLGPWRFLSLPDVAGTGAIFVGSGGLPVSDPESLLAHPNGARRLAAAWVEGGTALERFLEGLGAERCGTRRLPDGRTGTRWATARGTLVVVRGTDDRLVGVELEAPGGTAPRLHEPVPGFWIELRQHSP